MDRSRRAQAPAQFRNRLLQNTNDPVALLTRDHQRRTKLCGGVVAAVVAQDQPTIAHLISEPDQQGIVTECFFRVAVGNQLDTEEEAYAADIADVRVVAKRRLQSVSQVLARV